MADIRSNQGRLVLNPDPIRVVPEGARKMWEGVGSGAYRPRPMCHLCGSSRARLRAVAVKGEHRIQVNGWECINQKACQRRQAEDPDA